MPRGTLRHRKLCTGRSAATLSLLICWRLKAQRLDAPGSAMKAWITRIVSRGGLQTMAFSACKHDPEAERVQSKIQPVLQLPPKHWRAARSKDFWLPPSTASQVPPKLVQHGRPHAQGLRKGPICRPSCLMVSCSLLSTTWDPATGSVAAPAVPRKQLISAVFPQASVCTACGWKGMQCPGPHHHIAEFFRALPLCPPIT